MSKVGIRLLATKRRVRAIEMFSMALSAQEDKLEGW